MNGHNKNLAFAFDQSQNLCSDKRLGVLSTTRPAHATVRSRVATNQERSNALDAYRRCTQSILSFLTSSQFFLVLPFNSSIDFISVAHIPTEKMGQFGVKRKILFKRALYFCYFLILVLMQSE